MLVTAGVLLLAFVAYQLWGTGIFEARAQKQLRDDFAAQLEAQGSPTSTTVPPTTVPPTTVPPTTTTVPPTLPPAPLPMDGEATAIIRIPKIGVDKVVVEGTTVADLRKGPGHYTGTPLPGQIGNASIAGHRTTYGAPFNTLDQLGENDVISVQTLFGTYEYRVVKDGVFVVKPNQSEVLDPPLPGAAILTLTTCHPKYSARERLVVRAELDVQESPPPLPPPPELASATEPIEIDAGLSGERDSRQPTVLAGLVVALIGALWWWLFHRHPRWTSWLVGIVPFAAALFVFFAYLERVLPSNY